MHEQSKILPEQPQIASNKLPRVQDNVFLKTADSKSFVIAPNRAKICDLIAEELEKNQSTGTVKSPLVIPVSLEQIKYMDSFLGYVLAGDFIRLEHNELRNRDLIPLADVVKTAWTLRCTPICSLAKSIFIQKLKEGHLQDFASKATFIDSFEFPKGLQDELSTILLSPENLYYLRSLLLTSLPGKQPAQQLNFNLSGDHILSSGASGNGGFCDIWNVQAGENFGTIRAASPIVAADFLVTPLLAVLSNDTCILWNVLNAKTALKIEPQDHEQSAKKFSTMSLSSDHGFLALALGNKIILKDLKHKTVRILSHPEESKDLGRAIHLLFTPDCSTLIEIKNTGIICFWQIKTGSCIIIEEHQKPILKQHCNKNGVLATVDEEGKLCLWDCAANGKLLHKWDGQQRALCFNNAGDKLAITSDGTEGTIFDITQKDTGAKKFKAEKGTLVDACYHVDDELLAASTSNNQVCIWNTKDATLLAQLTSDKAIGVLRFSPDGNILATAHEDGKICFWHFCNKDIENYLKTEINFSKGLLLLLIIDAKKNNKALDFLNSGHLKSLYASLDANLFTKFLK